MKPVNFKIEVYMVGESNYEGFDYRIICSTREKAEEWIKNHGCSWYDIVPVILDEAIY